MGLLSIVYTQFYENIYIRFAVVFDIIQENEQKKKEKGITHGNATKILLSIWKFEYYLFMCIIKQIEWK